MGPRIVVLVLFATVARGRQVEVEDVTERSVNKRFPDELELVARYADGKEETLKVKRNPHFISNVQTESLSNNGVKRHAGDKMDRAEYISERAAIHVTAQHDGERYKRTLSGLIYRRGVMYVATPVENARHKRSAHDVTAATAMSAGLARSAEKRQNDGVRAEIPHRQRKVGEEIEEHEVDDEIMAPINRAPFSGGRKFPVGTDLLVDVMAIIDYSLYSQLRDQYRQQFDRQRASEDDVIRHVQRYYGIIFAAITQRYHSVNYGNMKIRPRLAKMIIATSRYEDQWTWNLADHKNQLNASMALSDIQEWFQAERGRGNYPDVDHTMAFTGFQLFHVSSRTGKRSTGIVGLAYTTGICGDVYSWSQSIVEEDLSLLSVGVGAHELGHSLGSSHDGGRKCPDEKYVMSPSTGLGNERTYQNVYQFSRCSQKQFYEWMENLNEREENCMTDDPGHEGVMKVNSNVAPGVRIDLHAQCRAYTGDEKSYYCGPNTRQYMERNGCYSFPCFRSDYGRNGKCVENYSNYHALYGTPCGKNKWCENAECVTAPREWHMFLENADCPLRDPAEYCSGNQLTCSDPEFAERCCNRCQRQG